jgi:hypothetical protein
VAHTVDDRPQHPIAAQVTAQVPLSSAGQSGNPGGRQKEVGHRELAKTYTAEAIEALVEIMRTGAPRPVHAPRLQRLLDRAWGKASQHVDFEPAQVFIKTYVLEQDWRASGVEEMFEATGAALETAET